MLILYNLRATTKENFANIDINEYLRSQINDYYNNKINNINNILNFVTNYNTNNNNITITSSNSITSNNITAGSLYLLGNHKINNLTINGNLTLSDNLIINDYRSDNYNKNINIIPRYMIIAWYNEYDYINKYNIPNGWVLCDGSKYYFNENNILSNFDNSININIVGEIIETPNLVDKFIIGSSTDITYGGTNFYNFKSSDIPNHQHFFSIGPKPPESNGISHGVYSEGNVGKGKPFKTKLDKVGTKDLVDIRPPFYNLYYIMKI